MRSVIDPVRVLVVDDDYRVAKIHAAYVERTAGFAVCGQAHSAGQALAAVAELRPDLVLMDVYLPDGDGLGVIRKLLETPEASTVPAASTALGATAGLGARTVMKATTATTASSAATRPDFVVITAARDVSTVRTAMQLGAVHYLVKPFGYPAMAEKLASYLDLRRRIETLDESAADADQSAVDELFGLLRAPVLPAQPGKGHSAPTLELVRNAVRAAGDVSAAEVAEQVGISRPTAQRYLSYLTRHGVVRLHLRYGTTGRPEHRYSPLG